MSEAPAALFALCNVVKDGPQIQRGQLQFKQKIVHVHCLYCFHPVGPFVTSCSLPRHYLHGILI